MGSKGRESPVECGARNATFVWRSRVASDKTPLSANLTLLAVAVVSPRPRRGAPRFQALRRRDSFPTTAGVTSRGVIKTADGITAEWLGSVLGADGLEMIGVEAIGTGQMSKVYRVSYRRPRGERESVAVKLAATDQNSRDVGVNLGAYLREITFYRELRDRIGGNGTLAECHLATHDPTEGWFTLVLEDIEDGVQGDQIAGCGPAEA